MNNKIPKKEIKQIWGYVYPKLKFKGGDESIRTKSVPLEATAVTTAPPPPPPLPPRPPSEPPFYANSHRTRNFNNNQNDNEISRSPSMSIPDVPDTPINSSKTPLAKHKTESPKRNDLLSSIARYEKSKKLLRAISCLAAFSSAFVLVGIALAIGLIIGLSKPTVRNYNESCSTGSDCKQAASLICQNNVCTCSGTMYYNGSSCLLLGTYNSSCQSSDQCSSAVSLMCSNGKCHCDTTTYWDGSSCVLKMSYTEPCSTRVPCQDYNFLTCNGTSCVCPSTHVWDPVQLTCSLVNKKTYTKFCLASSECNETAGLICPTTIGTCNCPVKSYTTFCDCRPGYFYDFSAKQCRELLTYGETCCVSYQCKQSVNLTCQSNICDCPPITGWFWSALEFKCVFCPAGWTVVSGHCYKVFTTKLSWIDAALSCEASGASLMAINDAAEFALLKTFYSTYARTSSTYIWVGANTVTTDFDFRWRYDNSKLVKTSPYWCPTEPNNYSGSTTTLVEGCAFMWAAGGTTCLNDFTCSSAQFYCCEIN